MLRDLLFARIDCAIEIDFQPCLTLQRPIVFLLNLLCLKNVTFLLCLGLHGLTSVLTNILINNGKHSKCWIFIPSFRFRRIHTSMTWSIMIFSNLIGTMFVDFTKTKMNTIFEEKNLINIVTLLWIPRAINYPKRHVNENHVLWKLIHRQIWIYRISSNINLLIQASLGLRQFL